VAAVLRRQAPTWCLQFPAVFSGSSLDNIKLEAIGANKDRMLRELGDALSELTLSMPVLLFLEDLHWADTSSVDLLRYLGQRLPRQRMLIVGTARPEDLQRSNHPLRNCQRELQAHGVCEELALAELEEEHVFRFLEQHFAPHAFPPEFARLIYRKTEGHPLFLTGAMQFLTERGEIVNRDGTWILTKPVSEMDLEVPASIRNMIRRQLEVLGEEDRRALQYASVEGEEFTSTVLAALLESDELELEERLAKIEKVHRLIRTRGEEEFPDGSVATRYRVAHALYQNILYEDLSNKRRALLHRRAGETLVRCYGAETARVAPALATHFERGRDNSRAIHYLLQAAEVAESRYANTVAEEHYSHVMRLAEGLPPEEKQRVRLTSLYRRGSLRLSSGRLPEAHTDFAEMLAQARVFGDAAQEGVALLALAELHFHAHHLPEMGVQAEQALQIAGRIGNQALRAEALANLGRRHQGAGDLEKAKRLYGESISIAQSIEHHKALTIGLTIRGVVHFFQTEYLQAERILTDASNLAAGLRDGMNGKCRFSFSA
jgi:predicted ATPase